MKTSIIYLGIALVTFTNVALAVDFEQSFEEDHRNPQAQTQKNATSEIIADSDTTTAKNHDLASITSDLPLVPVYEKTMEEIIAEDYLITEGVFSANQIEEHTINISIDSFPTTIEKPIEEIILEDQQIIENQNNNIKFPIIIGNTKEVLSLQQ